MFSTAKNQAILNSFGFKGVAGPTGNGGKGGEGTAFLATLPIDSQISYAVQRIQAGDAGYKLPPQASAALPAPTVSIPSIPAPTLASPDVQAAGIASQRADGGIINRAATLLTDDDIMNEQEDPKNQDFKSLLGA